MNIWQAPAVVQSLGVGGSSEAMETKVPAPRLDPSTHAFVVGSMKQLSVAMMLTIAEHALACHRMVFGQSVFDVRVQDRIAHGGSLRSC